MEKGIDFFHGIFNINSDSPFIGILLAIGMLLTMIPVSTVNAKNGGFIEDSSTFRFLGAIGSIFIGWKIASNLYIIISQTNI